MENSPAFIFDLDGIIVDTTHYHYLSWKELATGFNYDFKESDNELLKGANRITSLNILLDLAGQRFSENEKKQSLIKKNEIYLDLIRHMTVQDTMPGVIDYIKKSKAKKIPIALASSSQNAINTIEKLGLRYLFDALLDANKVTKGKPDPEVYVRIAERLKIPLEDCIVYEDASNGITAAKAAGMWVVGMGNPEQVKEADLIIETFLDLHPLDVIEFFRKKSGTNV